MNIDRNDLPTGWRHIVAKEIEGLIESGGISQIKEKFGQLRIYYKPGTVYNIAVHNMLEVACSNACMICGAGDVEFVRSGWIGPVCKDHRNKL